MASHKRNAAAAEARGVSEIAEPGGTVDQKSSLALSSAQGRRGGRRSRQKGDRHERHLVRFLQEAGIAAERVPLSGSVGGTYRGDITIPVLGIDRCAEAKCRADGFKQLYAWLQDRDLLILRADRREPLVVLSIRLAVEIVKAAEFSGRPEKCGPRPKVIHKLHQLRRESGKGARRRFRRTRKKETDKCQK